jgi:hypothetical protein
MYYYLLFVTWQKSKTKAALEHVLWLKGTGVRLPNWKERSHGGYVTAHEGMKGLAYYSIYSL